ncbi:MAG: hypothetical protein ACSHX6_04510 [Akkermansiaceae bacterium]
MEVDWVGEGGRFLMEGVEEWARKNGCAFNTVATRRAGAFYEAINYDGSAGDKKKLSPYGDSFRLFK